MVRIAWAASPALRDQTSTGRSLATRVSAACLVHPRMTSSPWREAMPEGGPVFGGRPPADAARVRRNEPGPDVADPRPQPGRRRRRDEDRDDDDAGAGRPSDSSAVRRLPADADVHASPAGCALWLAPGRGDRAALESSRRCGRAAGDRRAHRADPARHPGEGDEERAGPAGRFHHLRHSHATQRLSRGSHPKIAQERWGHSGIGITRDLYAPVRPGLQEDAAAQVDAALGAAIDRGAG
jgi:hypothetical protein